METLTIEPTYRVLLGNVSRFRIMLVGCGGTGSSLALALAGLAYHAQQKDIQVELTLVDHDIVELKNCGRQALSLQAAMVGGVPRSGGFSPAPERSLWPWDCRLAPAVSGRYGSQLV